MAFVDDEDDGSLRTGFSGKIVGVLVLAAAIVAGRFLLPHILRSPSEATPERVLEEIERQPGNRELFEAIRSNYPAEFETFLQRFADTANATKDDWPLREMGFNFTRGLARIHFEGLAHAPSDALREIARQYAVLYRTLGQTNVSLCARLATGGASSATDPIGSESVVGHIGALQISAARQGEIRPSPTRSNLNDREAESFMRALRARSDMAARLLLDERAMANATPTQQCQSTIALYETMGELPPDQAAKALVYVLREGLQTTSPGGQAPTPSAQ